MRSRSPVIDMEQAEPTIVVRAAPILVKAQTARKMLGNISDRAFFDLVSPKGDIPVIRLGNIRLFRVSDLQKWAKEQAQIRQKPPVARVANVSINGSDDESHSNIQT